MATTRRAVMGASVALAAVPGAAVALPAPQADAELIALCAQHIANWTAYNRDGGYLEPEDDPLWLAYEKTRGAISDAKPQTLAGILAKARAAKAEAQQPNGEDFDHGAAGRWAADVVNDLLRLSAGGFA